jgi:hypothetical protein
MSIAAPVRCRDARLRHTGGVAGRGRINQHVVGRHEPGHSEGLFGANDVGTEFGVIVCA